METNDPNATLIRTSIATVMHGASQLCFFLDSLGVIRMSVKLGIRPDEWNPAVPLTDADCTPTDLQPKLETPLTACSDVLRLGTSVFYLNTKNAVVRARIEGIESIQHASRLTVDESSYINVAPYSNLAATSILGTGEKKLYCQLSDNTIQEYCDLNKHPYNEDPLFRGKSFGEMLPGTSLAAMHAPDFDGSTMVIRVFMQAKDRSIVAMKCQPDGHWSPIGQYNVKMPLRCPIAAASSKHKSKYRLFHARGASELTGATCRSSDDKDTWKYGTFVETCLAASNIAAIWAPKVSVYEFKDMYTEVDDNRSPDGAKMDGSSPDEKPQGTWRVYFQSGTDSTAIVEMSLGEDGDWTVTCPGLPVSHRVPSHSPSSSPSRPPPPPSSPHQSDHPVQQFPKQQGTSSNIQSAATLSQDEASQQPSTSIGYQCISQQGYDPAGPSAQRPPQVDDARPSLSSHGYHVFSPSRSQLAPRLSLVMRELIRAEIMRVLNPGHVARRRSNNQDSRPDSPDYPAPGWSGLNPEAGSFSGPAGQRVPVHNMELPIQQPASHWHESRPSQYSLHSTTLSTSPLPQSTEMRSLSSPYNQPQVLGSHSMAPDPRLGSRLEVSSHAPEQHYSGPMHFDHSIRSQPVMPPAATYTEGSAYPTASQSGLPTQEFGGMQLDTNGGQQKDNSSFGVAYGHGTRLPFRATSFYSPHPADAAVFADVPAPTAATRSASSPAPYREGSRQTFDEMHGATEES